VFIRTCAADSRTMTWRASRSGMPVVNVPATVASMALSTPSTVVVNRVTVSPGPTPSLAARPTPSTAWKPSGPSSNGRPVPSTAGAKPDDRRLSLIGSTPLPTAATVTAPVDTNPSNTSRRRVKRTSGWPSAACSRAARSSGATIPAPSPTWRWPRPPRMVLSRRPWKLARMKPMAISRASAPTAITDTASRLRRLLRQTLRQLRASHFMPAPFGSPSPRPQDQCAGRRTP